MTGEAVIETDGRDVVFVVVLLVDNGFIINRSQGLVQIPISVLVVVVLLKGVSVHFNFLDGPGAFDQCSTSADAFATVDLEMTLVVAVPAVCGWIHVRITRCGCITC